MRKVLLFFILLLGTNLNAQETEMQQFEKWVKVATEEPKRKGEAIGYLYILKATSSDKEFSEMVEKKIAELNNIALIDKLIPSSRNLSELSKNDLKDYKVKEDKFRDVTFITPKVNMTSKYAYLSIKNNVLNMRIVMEHYGDYWIFFNKVIILYNGKKLEYDAGSTNRDVGSSGSVKETSDVRCSIEMIDAFREIVNTEKVEVRLSGDKISDFEMSNKTKKSIKLALELYDKLKK